METRGISGGDLVRNFEEGSDEERPQDICLKDMSVNVNDVTYITKGHLNTFTLCCDETFEQGVSVGTSEYETCPFVKNSAITNAVAQDSEAKEVQDELPKDSKDLDMWAFLD